MTDKQFLPEWSCMPRGEAYRPIFRLFVGDGWKFVREGGKPIELPTASQAVTKAKECVQRILNPPLRAQKAAESEPAVPDWLDADNWRQDKAREAEAERRQLFNTDSIFMKGREVQVERRRARA